MEEVQRLTFEDLNPHVQCFSSFERVLLAVSGGSDSLALLYLAAQWAKTYPQITPHFEVATIDHGLREGSYEEACRVRTHAEGLGLKHHLLPWRGPKPQTSLQELARAERYALLEEVALGWKEEKVAIATAHTMDDQGETVLMRLARGSGPDGLKGITPKRPLSSSSRIALLRPLLRVSRADLCAWLSSQNLSWEEDPSNLNTLFERVRLRTAATTLRSLGLNADKLALAAHRQNRAVDALEVATDDLQKACFQLQGGAYGSLDISVFGQSPEELRIRLLARVLNIFRGETPPAQLEQVERLVEDLDKRPLLRRTLGGCELHAKKKVIHIYREVGRASLPALPLLPGMPVVWDQRFRILLPQSPQEKHCASSSSLTVPLWVRPLDPTLYRALRENIFKNSQIPLRAAATLPSVWRGEKLLTICGLGSDKSLQHGSFPLTEHPIHAEFLRYQYAGARQKAPNH
ncbi:MAG: tRNA lysidine(34) synthetase TilS [Hyphomicrobium sp.]